MNRSIIFKVIMALVLLGALVGIGVFAFNAGLARGVALNLPASAGGTGTAPLPYPYYAFWHAFPFFGFGCFGVLIPLFLLFLVFGAFRGLFWHGPHRWRHMSHYAPWGAPPSGTGETGSDLPPMFAEWHRRMHEQKPDSKAE